MARRPKILNKDRLRRRLAALPEAIRGGMRDAVVAGAEQITGQMKTLVADDKELQEATGWVFGQAKNLPSGALVAGGRSGAKGDEPKTDLIVTIVSGSHKAFWARWREFGTHPHSTAKGASRKAGRLQDKGPHHPGERAQPYFFPAWRSSKKAVKAMIRKAVNAAIKKAVQTQ